jgi:hypothetical protein
MREISMARHATKRRWRAAVCGLIGMAVLIAGSVAVRAAEAEDDDDTTFEEKIIKDVLGAVGVDVGRQNSINYQERPPLVIPPSRDLPPPEAGGQQVNNPAWPINQESKKKKKIDAYRRNPNETNETSPNAQRELQQGAAVAGAGRVTAPDPNANKDVSRVLKPSELGDTQDSSWFSSWNINSLLGYKQEEQAQFKGEPPRTSLTQPPSGYQVPSPQYPYGINPSNKPAPVPSMMDRGAESGK